MQIKCNNKDKLAYLVSHTRLGCIIAEYQYKQCSMYSDVCASSVSVMVPAEECSC